MNKKGLYIHIPFCKYICKYCDFCKKYNTTFDNDKYVEMLIIELSMYKKYFQNIDSIYIGGGTPTSLSLPALDKLLMFLNENIDMDKIKEFTIEANPDDVTESLTELLYKRNVNRVSLGVQSLNDNILKDIKREHTKEDVQNAINILSLKIENISIDLMFNLPNQTKRDIEESFLFLKKNNEKIKHISYYSLILEENTILYNEKFEGIEEEVESDIYTSIQKNLEDLSYKQYEISNFSKDGYESFHNKKYWDLKEYIGVGLSASSYIDQKRYTATRSIKDYIKCIENGNLPIIYEEIIDDKENKKEKIIFGLRTKNGIAKDIKISENLKEYLLIKDGKISIKQEYLFLSNWIILQLLELNEK